MLELLSDPQVWIAFAHADRARAGARHRQHHLHLDPGRQAAGRSSAEARAGIGLFLAMFMRIGLLLMLSWIVGLTAPLFTVLGDRDFRARPGTDRAAACS